MYLRMTINKETGKMLFKEILENDEEDIIWQRKVQLKEGDVFICTNLISAVVYHVNMNQHYLKIKDGVVMVDKSILPYLKSEVKEIS